MLRPTLLSLNKEMRFSLFLAFFEDDVLESFLYVFSAFAITAQN